MADDDYGARVRAARCYADLNQTELGKRVGLERKVILAIEANKRELTIRQARRIAKVCAVPLLFLLEGFRLYEEAERAFTEPATGAPSPRPQLPAPPGALGRSLEADQTTREDPPQTSRPRGEGKRQGGAG